MKQQPLVSIIVPVYNGEVYLERCVDSILGQQYEQIELILVNDGVQITVWIFAVSMPDRINGCG